MVDTKVKITLIDGVSSNLQAIQNGFSRLQNTLSAFGFEGLTSIIKSGIEFNKTIETASVGMSGVLLSMTKLEQRELKWNEAMDISRSIIKDLNKQALLTAATPQELTQTFSGLMGIGLGRGLNIEQIKSFTVMGVNAVKSMGLEGRQLIQELRDLLQGSISPQKSTLATALGITGADIKKAQNSAEGLFKFLESRMNGFKISAKYFPDTFQGAFAVTSGAYEMLIAQAVEEPMKRVKELLKSAFTVTLNADRSGFSESLLKTCNEIGAVLSDIIGQITTIGKLISPAISGAGEIAGTLGRFASQHLTEIVAGIAVWKSVQIAMKPVAGDLLNIYDQINTKINETKATLAKKLSLEKAEAALVKELNGGSLYTLGMSLFKGKHESTSETIARRYAESKNIDRLFPLAKDKEGNTKVRTQKELQKVNETKKQLLTVLQDFRKASSALGLTGDEITKIQTKVTEAFPKMGSDISKASEMLNKFAESFKQAKVQIEEFTAYGAKVTAFSEGLQKLGFQEKQIVETQRQLISAYKEGGQVAAGALEKQILAIGQFSAKLQKLGLQEEQLINIEKQLTSAYQKGGEVAAGELMKQIELTVKLTQVENRRQKVIQFLHRATNIFASATMDAGIGLSFAEETFNNKFFSQAAEWLSKLSMLTLAFEGLWTAIGGPAALAITAATVGIGALLNKAEENAKAAGWGNDIWKLYSGTKEEHENNLKLKMLESNAVARAKRNGASDTGSDLADKLRSKFGAASDEEADAKAANKAIKLLDDANKVSASIAAKLANRTMSKEEQAYANLNKEVATFQEKIDTLKKNGQDVTALQEQLNNYTTAATDKIAEQFDTLKVRWDDVVIHIKDSQTNFTDIITAGYDSLASEFTSFGQNLITEGGSFMERFNELFKNFANNLCNTMMKIYLQGMLTKSVMSWLGFSGSVSFGGDYSKAVSVGGYSAVIPSGFANGGIASGWSLVGERGPELVNFSNPGRVYTNEETRSMLGGSNVNVKVNVINESGTPVNAQQQGSATWDGESYVVNVVMSAYATNRNGIRTLFQGAR